jgi:hypothetical protein
VAFGASIVWVNGKLGWGQCENQPAVSGIHGPEAQNITQKGTRAIRILAEQNRVNSVDHKSSILSSASCPRITKIGPRDD